MKIGLSILAVAAAIVGVWYWFTKSNQTPAWDGANPLTVSGGGGASTPKQPAPSSGNGLHAPQSGGSGGSGLAGALAGLINKIFGGKDSTAGTSGASVSAGQNEFFKEIASDQQSDQINNEAGINDADLQENQQQDVEQQSTISDESITPEETSDDESSSSDESGGGDLVEADF